MSQQQLAEASIRRSHPGRNAEDPVGKVFIDGREKLGLKRLQVTLATGISEASIAGVELNKDSLADAFRGYAEYLAKRLGAEWVAELREAALADAAAHTSAPADPVEQAVLAYRQSWAVRPKRDRRSRSSREASLAEMAQDGATVGSAVRRPRSSGERAAVKVPRLQSVSERIQAAWGMKPRTLEGMAA